MADLAMHLLWRCASAPRPPNWRGKPRKPGQSSRAYLHLGERQRRNFFADTRAVSKIFYARPSRCAALAATPPGSSGGTDAFPGADCESDLPAEVLGIVDDLMVRKAATRELGVGTLPLRSKA